MQFRDQEPGVKRIGQIEIAEESDVVDLVRHTLVQQMTGHLETL